jgi:hypothetical protein
VRYRDWGFGWFVLGDEIFHRGALVGIPRTGALAPFQHAAVLRPDFAPIWEHLAWAAIAEGDSAVAADALDHYDRLADQRDLAAATIGALLHTGSLWRFAPERVAIAASEQVLAQPAVAAWSDMSAAPSYLLTLDVPRATVWLGARFAQGVPRNGLETVGLLAQAYGLVALGRPDSAVAVARRAADRTSEPALALFAAELPAALALADSADLFRDYARLAGPLRAIADETSAAAPQRSRALWMLALLAWRENRGADGDAAHRAFESLAGHAGSLGALLGVVAGPGMHHLPAAALRRAPALVDHDSANGTGDPFYRTLLYLSRAEWQLAAQNPEQAVRELRWHENNDFVGYPGLEPQAGDVDYALGTLARWRRARLLESLGSAYRDEACASYAAVARNWREGDARFAARADSAAQHRRALTCPTAR